MQIIITPEQSNRKLERMAYQIYEAFCNEEELIIAGIADNGFLVAKQIGKNLEEISSLKISYCEIKLNKLNPLQEITTSLSTETYASKNIIIVDDVLNSGSTLIYAVKHFLNVPTKTIKTAVLVDRSHKKYPVKADFKGLSLSTSIQEHVSVVCTEDNTITCFLS